MVKKKFISTVDLAGHVNLLASKVLLHEQHSKKSFQLVAIERGGVPIAEMMASLLCRSFDRVKISFYKGEVKQKKPIYNFYNTSFSPEKPVLMIDDLVDTGATIEFFKAKLQELGVPSQVAVVYKKPTSTVLPDFWVEQTSDWIVFPWEKDDAE